MDIKTFRELIEWTADLHGQLARCLSHCTALNKDERARMLLGYLAGHETDIEHMVNEFVRQAGTDILETRVYDYLPHESMKFHRPCDEHFAKLDFTAVRSEVYDYHDQIIKLYKTLLGKINIPKIKELMEELLTMEQNEFKRLVHQISRMDDL